MDKRRQLLLARLSALDCAVAAPTTSGLTDRVIAIGSHGPWPAEFAALESAGSFDRPDLERILELECDLVLNTASVAASAGHERLERLGVAVATLDTSTFEGVFASLRQLGELFDREDRANEIAAGMRAYPHAPKRARACGKEYTAPAFFAAISGPGKSRGVARGRLDLCARRRHHGPARA